MKPVDPIDSIAILFGDNDFGWAMTHLLTTMNRAIKTSQGPPWTAADATRVKELLETGARWHYEAFQRGVRKPHGGEPGPGYLEKLKVLFNEEADRACLEQDHNYGAWHLHIESGQITAF